MYLMTSNIYVFKVDYVNYELCDTMDKFYVGNGMLKWFPYIIHNSV